MILRNLADALRTQNWFTVVLEVLIVIVGIFGGLQVDDWNSSRKDRIEERVYLERLSIQMQNNETNLSTLGPSLEERMQAVNFALSSLNMDPDLIDSQRFMIELGRTMNLRVIHLQTDVYEEMVSTGKINLISDIRLREELAGYLAAIAAMDKVDSIGTFHFFNSDYVPFLLEHLNMQAVFDGWYTNWMANMHRRELPDPEILGLEPHHPLKIQLGNHLVYLYSTFAWMKYEQEQFLDRTLRIRTLINKNLELSE